MKVIGAQSIDIADIVSSLREGKTLVYPTETCYGLGCDASHQLGVDAIFDIKQRQREKSVLVVVPSLSMMLDYVEWSPELQRIADSYWPGPLTVVTKAKDDCELAAGVIANDGTIAFRVSSHQLVRQISEALGKPLVSTSANVASEASPYDIDTVVGMFAHTKDKPDMVIDAGVLPHKSPSTIVKIDNGSIVVLRQGEIIIQ